MQFIYKQGTPLTHKKGVKTMAYSIIKMITYNTCKSIKLVNDEEQRKKQYDDIDQERTHKNKVIYGNPDYLKMYNQVMQNDYYTTPDKYGRTHKEPKIKGIGFIATFSPEAKENINPKEWLKANIDYFKKLFPNCPITITLHLDQTTPHLHVFVIPVTDKGKISKSSYINGKKDMFALQDSYAKAMEIFGLERGQHKEKKEKTHTDKKSIKKYQKIKNANIKLKKENEKLQQQIDDEIQRYDCIANMVTELEQQKEKLLYDINNLADSVLDDNYINPYNIER